MEINGEETAIMALYRKYRQILLYCVFGFCTFLVSVGTYAFCMRVLGINELIANAISWVFAVLFAFFTNRRWVFDGESEDAKGLWAQMVSFFGGRTISDEEADELKRLIDAHKEG